MNANQHFEDLSKPSILPTRGVTKEVAEEIVNPLRQKGYPTQYPSLDKLVGGLKLGSFIVIGAEQGRGKSIFALNLLVEQARQNIKSCYIDVENGQPKTWTRLLMINNQLDSESITGLTPREVFDMAQEINISYYNQKHLDLLKTQEITKWKDITIQLIKDRAEDGYKLFVIDPFSRFCEDDPRNEYFDEGVFAGELADLAEALGICIIAVHHLRKGTKAPRAKTEEDVLDFQDFAVPTLEGIRGSSKIVDRATEVFGFTRFPKPVGDDVVLLGVLKSRTGQTGYATLEFDKKTLTITENSLRTAFGGSVTEV